MYRLTDRQKTPPKGFLWIDPITTQAAEGRNYANWRSAAIEICVANGNPLPSEQEMEDQLCGRLDSKTRKFYCQQIEGDVVTPILGVGGTLKNMLASIGVQACWGCIDLAKKMDSWGPDGCEANMPEILASMEENANKRNWMRFIPFREQGSELLVRIAIAKVRERG